MVLKFFCPHKRDIFFRYNSLNPFLPLIIQCNCDKPAAEARDVANNKRTDEGRPCHQQEQYSPAADGEFGAIPGEGGGAGCSPQTDRGMASLRNIP